MNKVQIHCRGAPLNSGVRRPQMTKVTPPLTVLVSALLMPSIVSCSIGHANARVTYWTEETRLHVPVGMPIADAQAYFATQGLQLRCCMSGPDIEHAYYAMARDIGRFVFTEYAAQIVVDVSPDQRVTRVRVQRVGVGL